MIKRIIAWPLFVVIGMVFALYLWGCWSINFLRFGGEVIVYTHDNQRKTIADIYNKLSEGE